MNFIADHIELSTTELADETTAEQLLELSAHDLTLVGGGTANVCWL